MRTPAYILGVLDSLVKAGAVSSDYAAGFASVLTKQAGAAQNFHDNYKEWKRKHPDQRMDPEQVREMLLKSRPWYTRAFSPNSGWGNWFSNRIGKMMRGPRAYFGATATPSSEAYDRALRDMENRELFDYIEDEYTLPAEVAGAIQDLFVRDAGFRVRDAKRTMSDFTRREEGLTDDYADSYRTAQGEFAIRSGYYVPKWDKKPLEKHDEPPYGKDLPSSYGANKHLFYRVGYTNPIAKDKK